MRISLKDMQEAFDFVSAGDGVNEHLAFLCKQSGIFYWHSELCNEFDIYRRPHDSPHFCATLKSLNF